MRFKACVPGFRALLPVLLVAFAACGSDDENGGRVYECTAEHGCPLGWACVMCVDNYVLGSVCVEPGGAAPAACIGWVGDTGGSGDGREPDADIPATEVEEAVDGFAADDSATGPEVALFPSLVAVPDPIDFGMVAAGAMASLDVLLRNDGTAAIELDAVYLRLDGSSDFTIESIALSDGASLPFLLVPGASLGLVLKYAPTGGGADHSRLVAEGAALGQRAASAFEVQGEEVGPLLAVSPVAIDFGWVEPGTQAERLLQIQNLGNADLILPAGGVTIGAGSDEGLVLVDVPTGETRIVPDASVDVRVGWTPAGAIPGGSANLGRIVISSNDPNRNPEEVPVQGGTASPWLVVQPDSVDMGFAAQMVPVERQVTLRNDGHGTLEVASLSIVGVSDTRYAEEFQLVRGTEKGSSIAAFQIADAGSEGIKIVFTNKAAMEDAHGTVTAILRILSNDPGHGATDVPITVVRSRSPACDIRLVPSSLNFGTVAIGFPKDLPVKLINVGSGYCTFRSAQITDCSSGMMGGFACNAPFLGAASSIFTLSGIPDTTTNGLAPGSQTEMSVRFDPPASIPLFGLLNQYGAVLGIKVYDEAQKKEIVIPVGTGDPATYAANIQAASGIAKVGVLPGEVEFGATTIGCYSKSYKVCVYNFGIAPLSVTNVALKGCSSEFKVKNIPQLPISVANGTPKCIETNYSPRDEGADTCTLQIEASDASSPTVAVRLAGSGTYEAAQDDGFIQVAGQQVDVLFIIDDSGSMCEEQDRLYRAFNDFITHATVWQSEYHLGGISVNVTDEKVIGRLNRGDAKVTPRYVTPDNGGSFQKITQFGCNGGSDAQEAGLQAAQAALSAPMATDTGVSCTTDADCTGNAALCPVPAKCPYACVGGTCGGFNAGFLRPDAALEMVVLSDEEDQSEGGLAYYVDYFKNIKGWYNTDRMHFHAIVGISGVPAGGGSSGGDCMSPDGGTAEEGRRYLGVATQTGGLSGSICESSYSGIMNQIGAAAFRPKVQFFLSRLADPASVQLWVNGTACTSGWRYDAPSNAILFDEQGACMPEAGDTIRVTYNTLCLTS